MVAFRIEDIRILTQKLFLGTDFDEFLLKEANVVTFNSFTIDGRIRQGFYSDDELEMMQIEDFSAWKRIRPICFSLIKGKKLPGSFHINLQAAPRQIREFLQAGPGLPVSEEQIKGLYLHIRYEEGKLYCVTGTSLAFFTLDKTVEMEWDEYAGRFLREKGIAAVKE
ncbi:MAG: DUF5721 family protein [Lachnospiraceae bacterium]|nr:DUF5721 family protein [Lachnospiraceae bacterium]